VLPFGTNGVTNYTVMPMTEQEIKNAHGKHDHRPCPECEKNTGNIPQHIHTDECEKYQSVREAVEKLQEMGERYIGTRDVASVLEQEHSQGDRGYIGRILNDLNTVEGWSRSTNKTWRILECER